MCWRRYDITGLIDRRGLLDWADSIGARSELPRLIRRLVWETGEGVVALGFPAGEGVAQPGWDGTVRASQGTPFVPAGLSLWELSVEESASRKAESDYAKRTTTPDGSPTGECTYVAVGLRAWAQRSDWASEKTGEGRWKEVRALGVDDVEAWSEVTPVTHAWLSEACGLNPYGLVTAQKWWDRWSSATAPRFPPEVVVAGRDEAASEIRERLARSGELLTVRGSSLDEVAAFVASLAVAEESTNGGLLARTAFVDDVGAWRRLREHRSPLVLVALTEAVAEEFASGSAHVLVVPVPGGSGADIELPPVDSLEAAQVLKDEGLPEKEADAAGRLSRLSLLAARRHLANKPELHEPDWGKPPVSRAVRRFMLLGRWNENSDPDRTIVERATAAGYDDLREEVAALGVGGDPFLARLGGTIGVVSHVDAFLVLRSSLRGDDLETLREVVREVLTEGDPRLGLPQDDRWRAPLLGKTRSYSSDLRRGLASTLALLGAYGDQTIDGAGVTGSEWAAWMVREVLIQANADGTCLLWASLADVLPLLAEAAPSQFLEAVRAGTTGETPVLHGMFGDTEDGDPLSTESAHSSLLWALEVCVWSSDHFGVVVDLLACLDEIDPGGQLANRPFESLVAILRPWYPQNSVRPGQRLDAIDGMRDRHEDVAWRLLLALLPDGQGFARNISEPRFRDWKPKQVAVTEVEYWNFIDELYQRALTDVQLDLGRWPSLLEKVDRIPPHLRAETLVRLDGTSSGERLPPECREAIWEALREKAARHREFPDAGWALPQPEVAAIEQTAAGFQPDAPLERLAWLFRNQRPGLPEVTRRDGLAEYEAALGGLRAQAAAEIAGSVGWCRIRAFAETLENPWPLGEALAQAKRFELEENFLRLLGSENDAETTFAAGYARKRFEDDGWDWIDSHLAGGNVSGTAAARLLLYSGDYPRAWELAESLNGDVAEPFWQEFRPEGLGGDFAHVDFAVGRLIRAGRPGSALDMAYRYGCGERLSDERAELVASGLEALLKADDQLRLLSHHELMELFKVLEASDIPRDRLARLEWAYLPAFGFEDRPGALSAMLSQDPAFFVDVIQRIYRPRGPDDDEAAEDTTDEWEPEAEPEAGDEDQNGSIASNAYRLLSDWNEPPGLREDGTVDVDELVAWVTETREKLAESGHSRAGDSHIGRVLASAPAEADGVRPPAAVRDLLEKLQSAELEEGIRIELFNSRGVTTRGAFEGGDQERDLAASYAQQARYVAGQWPRTAALLRDLGAGYEREARWHDEDAERRRTGFDT